ncbi:ATPase [Novosphingobium fuchskuhlense]|uniref:ATPase n=1 Tax=Novosphingobium fuchskuhlense TaxID=1117702 RepID=A0A117UXU1_9SPHN|nr:SRPBCC domain-containing protein [Novosphingobium fuchskuhlense]KUR72833.1 ATPase [Novosphingobium fuchskuhlense]
MNALTITRIIAAPTERVWDVLVNRMEEWWCPRPWRAEIVLQERRAGGAANMVMHGPNGEVMPNEGMYLAWDEGRRFVVTDAVRLDPATGTFLPSGPFMIGTWEVAAEGDGTRYTASARHWTEEAMKQHRDMGFEAGWNAAADQLQALCEAG